jgi:hypothetical protein
MSVRIVIIGGAGYLGARAVSALRARGGVDVLVAGRSGRDVIVDLTRPETFAALDGADVVVNASTSHGAAPDALAAHCLQRGLVLLECSSDRVVIERLLAARGADAAGAVVLGAGIYTGLSNLLGRAASDAVGGATALEIGIRSTPFSGAGPGTIDLMLDAMAVPAAVVRAGVASEVAAALTGPTLPFPRQARRTLTFSFPEVPMLAASTGAADVALGFAPAPALLWPSFRVLPTWALTSRPFRALMRVYFRVLRLALLGGVPGRVELVARARGPGGEAARALVADDGFAVAGAAIAAMATHLARRAPRPRGTVTIDEVMTLAEAAEALRTDSAAASLTIS